MLEFANTTPANGKKMKEETYAKEQGVQAPPVHTHTKKTRFGIRVKGSHNLGLRALDNDSYFGTVCVGG